MHDDGILKAPPAEDAAALKERVEKLLKAASAGLYERGREVRLAFLAAAAGESVFMLGPPGVAKSLVARRLKHCFAGAKSFEYLMGRFSTPEEVFGPISISKLKNEDKYERLVDSYLPGADVAFLDEIWKASPPIQNSLLTAINERVYRNGDREISLPLKALVSASNELPPEGEGLEALWDRFLVRLFVGNIADEGGFRDMLRDEADPYADAVPEGAKVTKGDWETWRGAISSVALGDPVMDLIGELRRRIAARNEEARQVALEAGEAEGWRELYVSDRRWKKIAKLLKACAYLDGRRAVDVADCLLIKHCLWSRFEEIEECADLVDETVRDKSYAGEYPVAELKNQVRALREDIEAATTDTLPWFVPQAGKEGFVRIRTDKPIVIQDISSDVNGWYFIAEAIEKLEAEGSSQISIYQQANRHYGSLITVRKDRSNSLYAVDSTGRPVELPLEGTMNSRKVRKSDGVQANQRKEFDMRRNAVMHECENADGALKVHRKAVEALIAEHLFINKDEGMLALENLSAMTNEIRKIEVELDELASRYA